jgi:hypothetical protein
VASYGTMSGVRVEPEEIPLSEAHAFLAKIRDDTRGQYEASAAAAEEATAACHRARRAYEAACAAYNAYEESWRRQDQPTPENVEAVSSRADRTYR